MGLKSIAMIGLAMLTGLAALGCDQEEAKVLKDMKGAWETSTPAGGVEKVSFDVQTVTYGPGSEDAYTCPYRVNAYHEKEAYVEVRIKCKQRTGADAWIDYRLDFQPDRQSFTLKLDKRDLGTYRRAS